ncbi:hypothetical protein QWY90_02590 [Flavobacterium paronense]|uniref:Carboxypeptidase-like regulatory domain-containing protein n=1 Tax=Flavobacterium paronense TaxID=1392775 RepID=A0ABV5GCY3_9FLAO|nr:hypothetical protein [Flavobacterium paronense]MDN3676194.1 hypothetical protein [Flavobacterium paronense]
MKLFKSIIIFLFFAQAFAQTPTLTLIKGKITSQIKELNDVYVANLRSESTTTTDNNGNFSMFVKVGDTLQFSGLQVVIKKAVITENDLAKQLFVENLEAKVNALDEVEIKQYKAINAVSLGILERPAKVYTPAERKLRTAEELHWYSPLLIPLGGMPVDGLINSISGRTAMLKKELVIEKKEKLLQKIEYLFKQDYFLENLKIPKEYLRGFWYYAVEDPKLVSALNTKNKIMARFIFSDLATKYLDILKN